MNDIATALRSSHLPISHKELWQKPEEADGGKELWGAKIGEVSMALQDKADALYPVLYSTNLDDYNRRDFGYRDEGDEFNRSGRWTVSCPLSDNPETGRNSSGCASS